MRSNGKALNDVRKKYTVILGGVLVLLLSTAAWYDYGPLKRHKTTGVAPENVVATGTWTFTNTVAFAGAAPVTFAVAPAITPTAHATSHQHGGTDEVATYTATANAIPKAWTEGKLLPGWMPYGMAINGAETGTAPTATGVRAAAFGTNTVASGENAFAAGRDTTASGAKSVAIGNGNNVSGASAGAVAGNINVADTDFSFVMGGRYGNSPWQGWIGTGSTQRAASGDSQSGYTVLRVTTTDATANVQLFFNATSSNHLVLAANRAVYVTADILGFCYSGTNAGKALAMTVRCVVKRDGSNSTTLAASPVEVLTHDGSAGAWTASVTADDTNEAIKVQATGAVGDNINWVARVTTVEAQ